LGFKVSEENYTIGDPVRSDGLLRVYSLGTPYGSFTAGGDYMLRMRLNELAALRQLEQVSQSEHFGKALVDAGLSPLKYTGRLITNPVQTVGDTLGGISNFFGSISSSMANAGKTQGDPVKDLMGTTTQKRQLAARFGVDPYTDFEPLNAKLTQLSEAAAVAGLTVSGALFFVPGAAGIVVSNLHTANTLNNTKIEQLARDYTAAQIMDLNRRRMIAMGVDGELTERVLANRTFTPVDMATIVAALDSMANVADRRVFFERVAQVDQRSIALFMRRHAELVAVEHRRTGGSFARFASLGGYPFNITRDRRIVGVLPIDIVSWTETTATALGDSTADMRRIAPSRAEIKLTGRVSALAKQRLQQMGWQVAENVRF
jgi:hypothetical protein